MINYFKDFLLNLFLVFLPLTLYPYLLKADRTSVYNRIFAYIVFSFALVSTMSFPVIVNNSTVDFRAVPLAIGSLYGGVYVSAFLYVTLVCYRYFMGNPHQLAYIFSIFPSFFFILWFIKKFPNFSLLQKVGSSILVYIIIRFCSLAGYSYLTQSLDVLLNFFVPPLLTAVSFLCLITGLYVYMLEFFKRNSQLHKEIMKSEKLKIVSEIAASVAHEVRNPLTSVRGFIQLMGKDDLSADNRRYYQTICLEELDRAQQIISDYLTFAKPEIEKIEVIDLKSEIDYIVNILISYANYQNVQVIKQMPEDSLLIVGDKYKLRQALINIGKNSIEAMPDGGLLTFAVHALNRHAVISIIDTGVGMTAEQIIRLGTPYYSTKDKGTGLGTMVSFSILKKMHGKIDIKSEQGKGTTHIISLELMKGQPLSN